MWRRPRQLMAFVSGDHSEETSRALWARVPQVYRKCHSFSDFWKACAAVPPEEIHRSVGKESGEPLSFSKKNWWHNQVTHWFIVEYNLPYLVATT